MLTILLGSALSFFPANTAGDTPATAAWKGLMEHYATADALELDARFLMAGDDSPYRVEMKLAKGLRGKIAMTRGAERILYVGNGKGMYVLNEETETYLKLPGGYGEVPVIGYLQALKNWAGVPVAQPSGLTWIEQTPPNPLMQVIKAEFADHTETLWIGPDFGLLAASLEIKMGDLEFGGSVTFSRAAAIKGIDPESFSGQLPKSYSEVFGSGELLLPVGIEVPDVTLSSLDGEEFQLDDLRGKTLLLNFWFYT
ncbi:MAG: hypothetical protein ACI9F9_001569 [Candidatus Paceibacteria bacterium]|jgi:hypothetical protein